MSDELCTLIENDAVKNESFFSWVDIIPYIWALHSVLRQISVVTKTLPAEININKTIACIRIGEIVSYK